MADPIRVCFYPPLPETEDTGEGGIRRVLEGQTAFLPQYGVEVVNDPARADVLACHVTIPPPWLNLYPNKAIVAHVHGLYWSPDYEWDGWAHKVNGDVMQLARIADAITAPSEWVAQALRRHTLRPVSAIYHGVDAAAWTHEEHHRGYVLWNKNRPDPVCDPRVVDELAQRMPEIPFVTTFGTERANEIITGRVPHEAMAELVSFAGIYLCTTRETFGIGTLEAMAAGVPVVGYNFGGQREIITHGVDGWLVEPGDLAGLEEGIRWGLTHRDVIAAAAREKAERFTWAKAAQQYAAVYRAAVEARQRTGPAVSVIVTAHGVEATLGDTLESVALQLGVSWECIVVDDASPDRSGAIADEYARRDSRFRVVHLEQNRYLAGARNAGIALACGRYIMPLDGDDLLGVPSTLTTLAGELDRDREIHIAYGGVFFVEPDGTTPVNYGHRQGPGYSGWPIDFNLKTQLRQRGQSMPYASMFRREVWELTGGFRTRWRSSEDCDFYTRASSYGFVPRKVTEAVTLLYRVRPESMSATQGWQDEEVKRWFPWAGRSEALPAAAYLPHVPSEAPRAVPCFDPPMVSVVIPVGPGHAPYVIDALDSLDAQGFRWWEAIVVNDTGEPLPPLPSWVRVVEAVSFSESDYEDAHPGNERPAVKTMPRFGGVAAARNAGARAARGWLLLWLDADDMLEVNALEFMTKAHVEAASPERGAPFVYTDFWEDPEAAGELRRFEAPDYDARLYVSRGLFHAVTALMPRDAFEAVGGFDESLPAWEDYDLYLALAAAGYCGIRLIAPGFTYRKFTGARRADNYDRFDESKSGILAKWADYFAPGDEPIRGGVQLMACGRCGTGIAMAPAPPSNGNKMYASDALVLYTGQRGGVFRMRGAGSGTTYQWAAGEPPQFVRAEDVEGFVAHGTYAIMAEDGGLEVPSSPVLKAGGPPNGSPQSAVPGLAWVKDRLAAFDAAPRIDPPEPRAPDVVLTPPDASEGLEAEADGGGVAVAVRPPGQAGYPEAELRAMSRAELNGAAEAIGIEGPQRLQNKDAVVTAILARQELVRSMNA